MTTELRKLPTGKRGRVVRVNAEGETARRLREMGLVAGAEVEMKGRATFLDPLALRLSGFTLALRNCEADTVTVEVCS